MKTIVIADDDGEYQMMLWSVFSGVYAVRSTTKVSATRRAIEKYQPDLLLRGYIRDENVAEIDPEGKIRTIDIAVPDRKTEEFVTGLKARVSAILGK